MTKTYSEGTRTAVERLKRDVLGAPGGSSNDTSFLAQGVARQVKYEKDFHDFKRSSALSILGNIITILEHFGPRELQALDAQLPSITLPTAMQRWDKGFWRNFGSALEPHVSKAMPMTKLHLHLKRLDYEFEQSKRDGWISPESQRFLHDFRDLAAALNQWPPEFEWPRTGMKETMEAYLEAQENHVAFDNLNHAKNQKEVGEALTHLSKYLENLEITGLLAPRSELDGPYQSASWTGRIGRSDDASAVWPGR